VYVLLQVEAGLVLEPPNQKTRVSLVLVVLISWSCISASVRCARSLKLLIGSILIVIVSHMTLLILISAFTASKLPT
jgi:hypothetical protein